MEESALKRDKDLKVVDIIKLFLRSVVFYRRLYDDYQRDSLRFADVQKLVDDRGQSLLFNLKKDCHTLYRGNDSSIEKEKLFDLAVGSIFHECMIIRENCYQLEVYKPKVKLLEEKPYKTAHEKKFLRELNNILNRAQKRLSEGLKITHALFTETLEELRDLLACYNKNGLLVRFLLENEGLVKDALGQRGLEEVFSAMYPKGRLEAMMVASRSYYESGYYEKAADMLKKALDLDSSQDVRFLYLFYSGLRDYYNGNLQEALENLQAAKELGRYLPEAKDYLEKIDSIASRITQVQPEVVD